MSFKLKNTSENTAISFEDAVSKTEQHHKKSCDLKYIISSLVKRGEHPLNSYVDTGEVDLTQIPDFQQAQEIITHGKSLWHSLSSSVRLNFENDMNKFVDFMSNSDNYEAITEMGFDASYLGVAPKTEPELSPAPTQSADDSPTSDE